MTKFQRETIIETPMYADDLRTVRLRIAAGASLHISEVRRRKGDIFYGKTPGGWALLADNGKEYINIHSCAICMEYADPEMGLAEHKEPSFELTCCGVRTHVHCLENMLKAGSTGKMISLSYASCFACRTSFLDRSQHWPGHLWKLVEDAKSLKATIDRITEAKDFGLPEEEKGNGLFFMCQKCNHPFCAGKVSCAEEFELDPANLICDGCQWAVEAKDNRCFKHGKDYALFKCDFCCNVASWACYSHHYCNYCHDHGGYKHPTPCPGGDLCPLGMPHPPPIQKDDINKSILSFVIGCRKCSNPHATIDYQSSNLNPFDNNEKGDRRKNAVQLFDYNKKKKRPEIPEDCDLQGFHLFETSDEEDELEDKLFCIEVPESKRTEVYIHKIEDPPVMIPAQSS